MATLLRPTFRTSLRDRITRALYVIRRDVIDRYLPPDHDAFIAAEPPTGRLIVIAPTRAACETIELAMGLH